MQNRFCIKVFRTESIGRNAHTRFDATKI